MPGHAISQRHENLRAACGPRQEERGLKFAPKRFFILAGNLIYDVSGTTLTWNGGHMPGKPFPTLSNSGPTKIHNNVFIAERDNLGCQIQGGVRE